MLTAPQRLGRVLFVLLFGPAPRGVEADGSPTYGVRTEMIPCLSCPDYDDGTCLDLSRGIQLALTMMCACVQLLCGQRLCGACAGDAPVDQCKLRKEAGAGSITRVRWREGSENLIQTSSARRCASPGCTTYHVAFANTRCPAASIAALPPHSPELTSFMKRSLSTLPLSATQDAQAAPKAFTLALPGVRASRR